MSENNSMPILVPIDEAQFWQKIRSIIQEEVQRASNNKTAGSKTEFETPGLIEKPLYKVSEICKLFGVSRPTIYDWIKHGKLKPFKIRSRVFFLNADIQRLLAG